MEYVVGRSRELYREQCDGWVRGGYLHGIEDGESRDEAMVRIASITSADGVSL